MDPLRIVEPDPEAEYEPSEVFDQARNLVKDRLPLLYHEPTRTVYMGKPDWFHFEVANHHGVPEYHQDVKRGYLGGGENWGQKNNLGWYDPAANSDEIREALGQVYGPVGQALPPPWEELEEGWD